MIFMITDLSNFPAFQTNQTQSVTLPREKSINVPITPSPDFQICYVKLVPNEINESALVITYIDKPVGPGNSVINVTVRNFHLQNDQKFVIEYGEFSYLK